jgi:FAD-linked sulfhydryl oxidase
MKFSTNPEIWGPSGWIFIHSIALQYPISPTTFDKKRYIHFFKSLGHILPCCLCQTHYQYYLKTHKKMFDRAFSNRKSLFKWTLQFHNYVNKKLKKPKYNIQKVMMDYKQIYNN